MRARLNRLFRTLLEDKRYLLLGQSICDPYGGAAKVTRGISKKYPDQVIDCPISESAMIGISTGLAMQRFIPITEIMFADFLTLCTDQLFNVACKLISIHGLDINMVVRAMEAPKEYGPTHSQHMEWLKIPGVNYFRDDERGYRPEGIHVVYETKNKY